MMRTSLYLPESLHHRLLVTARRQDKSISHLVRHLIDKALAAEEDRRLGDMFRAWDDEKGVGKTPVSDTSATIDEILYGENGAWRGSER